MNSYLVDDIEQVFDAHGNKHFVFAAASGSCHPDGTDISEPIVRIVVPHGRLLHLAQLLNQLVKIEQQELSDIEPQASNHERLGSIIFSDAT